MSAIRLLDLTNLAALSPTKQFFNRLLGDGAEVHFAEGAALSGAAANLGTAVAPPSRLSLPAGYPKLHSTKLLTPKQHPHNATGPHG